MLKPRDSLLLPVPPKSRKDGLFFDFQPVRASASEIVGYVAIFRLRGTRECLLVDLPLTAIPEELEELAFSETRCRPLQRIAYERGWQIIYQDYDDDIAQKERLRAEEVSDMMFRDSLRPDGDPSKIYFTDNYYEMAHLSARPRPQPLSIVDKEVLDALNKDLKVLGDQMFQTQLSESDNIRLRLLIVVTGSLSRGQFAPEKAQALNNLRFE